MENVKFNFLIGGTEPSGLNQLYYLLRNHSDIFLPESPQPEPNFFSKDNKFSLGYQWYHNQYLKGYKQQQLVGEKSGRYLWHPDAPSRILEYNPDMKMIFILRDPVHRAFSNYRFNCLNGIESNSFEKAIEKEAEQTNRMADDPFWKDIQPFAYASKGMYASQLKNFFKVFDKKNIYITRNDYLSSNTEDEVKKILDFLDAEKSSYSIPLDAPTYPSFNVKSLFFQKMVRKLNAALLEETLMKYREGIKGSILNRIIGLNLDNSRPRIEGETELKLRELFHPDLSALNELINMDVSDWMIKK